MNNSLEQIDNKTVYVWKNPNTGKKEDVKGERIAAFYINYPDKEIKIYGKKDELDQETKKSKSNKE